MIADSNKHIFDAVIVHKLDRFARNRYDSVLYKRELKKNGVSIYSVLENLDDLPESVILESLLEGMSEYYSRNLAREVNKGLKENALKCVHTGGTPPLGFDIDGSGKLVINEHEAEAVRLIFKRYSEGHTYSSIISELNNNGYTTKNGVSFGKNSLHDILVNEKYNGIYVYNREKPAEYLNHRELYNTENQPESLIRIEGGCPRIVDAELFEAVQQKMLYNRKKAGQYKAKYFYLLSGIVRCEYCGRIMYGNNRYTAREKKLHFTYRCPSHRDICKYNKEINQFYLEEYIVNLLLKTFGTFTSLNKLAEVVNQKILNIDNGVDDVVKKACQRIDEIKNSIQNIMRLVENGDSIEAVTNRITDLEHERVQLELKVTKFETYALKRLEEQDVKDLAIYNSEILLNGDNEEKRNLVRQLINEIRVDHDNVYVKLRTGLGYFEEFDTTVSVSRSEIYARFGAFVKSDKKLD